MVVDPGGQVRATSRNLRDITRSYPELRRLPDLVEQRVILDGELVALAAEHGCVLGAHLVGGSQEHPAPPPGDAQVLVGYTTFPGEIVPLPRIWAERIFQDKLIYFNKVDRGGHFAAVEQPEIFTEEVRKFARPLR